MNAKHKTSKSDGSLASKTTENQTSPLGHETIQDDTFSYEGYEVVRGEFFAHTNEPSITFSDQKVSVNTACLKRLPDVEHVQILVNRKEKKLAVRPSSEDEKDSFVWCTKSEKRRPKRITCRIFFAKIMHLMKWNSDYRHKLLGKLVYSNGKYLFIFNLTMPNTYRRISKDDGKTESARTPTFPKEWQNQFGLPVDEHRQRPLVKIFKGHTVFSIENNVEEKRNAHE